MEIEIIDAHNNTSHAAFLWIYTFIVDMANETHTYRINRRSSIAQIFHRIYHIHRNHINKHNTSDNFFLLSTDIWGKQVIYFEWMRYPLQLLELFETHKYIISHIHPINMVHKTI